MAQSPKSERIAKAMKAVESLFGCRFTIHDFTGRASVFLGRRNCPPEHKTAFCDKLKAAKGDFFKLCCKCDVERTNPLAARGLPFLKECHAGLVELVLPLRSKSGAVYGVLFAGPFLPGEGLPEPSLRQSEEQAIPEWLEELKDELPVLEVESLERLDALCSLLCEELAEGIEALEETGGPQGRKDRMEWFFKRNFMSQSKIGDLAAHLGLGESRTSQLLRELFASSFPEMTNAYRLDFAEKMLRNSKMPMASLARLAGFATPAYFFRQFKRKHGMTPTEYRDGTAANPKA